MNQPHERQSPIGPIDILGKKDTATDPYDLPSLRHELSKFGYRVDFRPQIPTTMTIVDQEALAGNPPLLVALTEDQTAGIGRDETKKWYATPGSSILFSALFHVDENTIEEFSNLIALRVCLALRQTGADIQIKPPNDIVYKDGKKISGILVRNIYTQDGQYLGTNVGVGVNVHYTEEQLREYPTDYGATSIDAITGRTNSRQQLLVDILEGIATVGSEARVINHTPSVRNEQDTLWQQHSYALGKNVVVTEGGTVLAKGIMVKTEIGRGIAIKLQDGKEQKISIFDTNTRVRIV